LKKDTILDNFRSKHPPGFEAKPNMYDTEMNKITGNHPYIQCITFKWLEKNEYCVIDKCNDTLA